MADAVVKNKINVLMTTPTRLKIYFAGNEYRDVLSMFECICTSGEPLTADLLSAMYEKSPCAKIYNPIGELGKLVFLCGVTLLLGSYLGRNIEISDYIKFTFALSLFILGTALPFLLFAAIDKIITKSAYRFIAVVALTSPLIAPSTIEVISLITSLKSLPSFAINDGFVVTPQIIPISLAFLISSTFAVSIKNFI